MQIPKYTSEKLELLALLVDDLHKDRYVPETEIVVNGRPFLAMNALQEASEALSAGFQS